MRSSPWLLCACLSTAVACTGPERDAFPEDPTGTATAGTSGAPAGSTGSSPSSSGSTASTASSSDGGGGSGASGPGPGGGDPGPGPGVGGGGGEATGGGGVGGSPPECDAGAGVCVPSPPAGWTGPVALYEGPLEGSLPQCNLTPYATQLGDYLGDLDEGDPSCSCTCADATGMDCAGNATLCFRDNFNECNQNCAFGTTQNIPQSACTFSIDSDAPYVTVVAPPASDPGVCGELRVDDIPDPVWGLEARVCSGGDPTEVGCDAGKLCTPLPGDSLDTLCIVHSGEEECPDSVWTVPHVRHTSFDDARECSDCSCGPATTTCGGAATFINDCEAPFPLLIADIAAGNCASQQDGFNTPAAVEFSTAPEGHCDADPGTGELSGEVTVDGTVTLCCLN